MLNPSIHEQCTLLMASPSPPSSPQPSISTWLRLSPLGSGSFGHVFLALNLDDSSLFAVKSAPPSASSSSPELLALQNELHILQTLHSPSIIQCLGANASTVGTVHNLFLEYMDCGSLADAAKQSGGKFLDELLVRRYTRSILQGLAYLHQNGVVHCDIKSQNILMGSTGAIKIADFGCACRLGEVSPSNGNLRGTPLWMAPEVAQGAEPKPSSDIWSLGCTVVEMLQGRPPWGHVNSIAAALFKVGCSMENPPLPESISVEAKEFLMNCLQRDPEARWAAEELLKHPFVCNLEAGEDECRKCEQPSPRSTLDYLHSDSESDWEEEYPVPFLCIPPRSRATEIGASAAPAPIRNLQARTDISEGSNWITVKRIGRWSEERQVAFMKAGGAGEAPLQVRRGCDVSLASAEFLRRRAHHTVG